MPLQRGGDQGDAQCNQEHDNERPGHCYLPFAALLGALDAYYRLHGL